MRKLPVIGILLALVVSCTQMASSNESGGGKAAPDLSLKTIDGKDVKLSDLKGKVVVLDFWAVFCPPCRESLPNLSKISSDADLAKSGLVVIAVNCSESLEKAKSYIEAHHLKLTVALDPDGAAQQAYGVSGIPNTFVIGRDGNIKHAIEGFSGKETEDELNAAVKEALAAPAK